MGDIRKLTFDDIPGAEEAERKRRRPDIRALSFDDIEPAPLTPIQTGGAVASGFNRSILSGIPGLPVKTALDVADLARAGYGYAGNKLGLIDANNLPEPLNRSRFAGSPEWIAERIASSELGAAAINNPRPDNPAARILHSGGAAIGAGMSANPRDAAMQFASGLSGQAAAEGGADPAWALLAGMGPQVARTGFDEGRRRAIRGGEQGRRAMVERMEDFQRSDVEPTVGLATGGRGAQAVESALAKTPGGAGVMAKRIEQMQDEMGRAANAARDEISAVYGPAVAGDAIKQAITGYRSDQQRIYGQMQDQALRAVPEGMRFPADSMLSRGAATLADIDGAPNVSRVVNKPLGFTQEVLGALNDDVAPHPARQVPSSILRNDGTPFTSEIPGTPGGIPFEGLKALKTRVGQLAFNDNPLTADANAGAMKHLYGGAKNDLRTAGSLADQERMARGQQPGVLRQLDRADRFYSQTQTIIEKTLAPIYKAGDPASEKSFYRVESDLRNSGQGVSRLMASLPLEARRQTAATVVDRLGRAAPGQQNAEGTLFNGQTFLTNWNRLTPDAKSGIFLGIPNREGVRDKLDSLAKVAERMRDANKVYANPSGTAQATNVVGAAAGLAGGVALMASGNVKAGLQTTAGILGSMALANWGARAMTNPQFVTWLSQSTAVKPERVQQHLRRLAITAAAERDPEQRAMLEGLANELEDELGAAGR